MVQPVIDITKITIGTDPKPFNFKGLPKEEHARLLAALPPESRDRVNQLKAMILDYKAPLPNEFPEELRKPGAFKQFMEDIVAGGGKCTEGAAQWIKDCFNKAAQGAPGYEAVQNSIERVQKVQGLFGWVQGSAEVALSLAGLPFRGTEYIISRGKEKWNGMAHAPTEQEAERVAAVIEAMHTVTRPATNEPGAVAYAGTAVEISWKYVAIYGLSAINWMMNGFKDWDAAQHKAEETLGFKAESFADMLKENNTGDAEKVSRPEAAKLLREIGEVDGIKLASYAGIVENGGTYTSTKKDAQGNPEIHEVAPGGTEVTPIKGRDGKPVTTSDTNKVAKKEVIDGLDQRSTEELLGGGALALGAAGYTSKRLAQGMAIERLRGPERRAQRYEKEDERLAAKEEAARKAGNHVEESRIKAARAKIAPWWEHEAELAEQRLKNAGDFTREAKDYHARTPVGGALRAAGRGMAMAGHHSGDRAGLVGTINWVLEGGLRQVPGNVMRGSWDLVTGTAQVVKETGQGFERSLRITWTDFSTSRWVPSFLQKLTPEAQDVIRVQQRIEGLEKELQKLDARAAEIEANPRGGVLEKRESQFIDGRSKAIERALDGKGDGKTGLRAQFDALETRYDQRVKDGVISHARADRDTALWERHAATRNGSVFERSATTTTAPTPAVQPATPAIPATATATAAAAADEPGLWARVSKVAGGASRFVPGWMKYPFIGLGMVGTASTAHAATNHGSASIHEAQAGKKTDAVLDGVKATTQVAQVGTGLAGLASMLGFGGAAAVAVGSAPVGLTVGSVALLVDAEVDSYRERNLRAQVPQAQANQVLALLPKHGAAIASKDPLVNAFLQEWQQLRTEGQLGRDLGSSKVGRIPVSAQETAARIESASRGFLAHGGSIDALRDAVAHAGLQTAAVDATARAKQAAPAAARPMVKSHVTVGAKVPESHVAQPKVPTKTPVLAKLGIDIPGVEWI